MSVTLEDNPDRRPQREEPVKRTGAGAASHTNMAGAAAALPSGTDPAPCSPPADFSGGAASC